MKIFRWVKISIVIYCMIGIGLYYLQEKILFHPTTINSDSAYHFSEPFTEENIFWDAQTKFNLVRFSVPDSLKKGLVIYFHGNRDNITRYALFAKNFTKNGYEVWMPDYPGFGKSTGELTEQILYDEALQVYKMARIQYQPEQIILYGKSIGTGIAAELASVRDCKRLILETPYYSITSLTRTLAWMYPLELLLHFSFPTHTYLSKVTAPISIFQGTADFVVPYFNAKRLQKKLKPRDEFITLIGGSHHNLNTFPLMQKKLDSLLQK